jgi:hypothetical protein
VCQSPLFSHCIGIAKAPVRRQPWRLATSRVPAVRTPSPICVFSEPFIPELSTVVILCLSRRRSERPGPNQMGQVPLLTSKQESPSMLLLTMLLHIDHHTPVFLDAWQGQSIMNGSVRRRKMERGC